MIIKLILFIILILVVFYNGFIFFSEPLMILGFVLLAIVILAAIYLRYAKKKVFIRVEVPVAISETGRPVRIAFRINNTSKLPIRRIKLHLKVKENFYNNSLKTIDINNIKSGQSTHFETIKLGGPGSYQFLLDKYTIYDYFAFFTTNKKMASLNNVYIFPELTNVAVDIKENTYNFYSEVDYYDELELCGNTEDDYKIREYHEGDKLQSIHWKLSVKNDDLFVRVNGLPISCPVVLFLNASSFKDARIIQSICSLSFALLESKCNHYACWFSTRRKEIIRTRIIDEESYYQFILAFMRDVSDNNKRSLNELYSEKYKGDVYLYSFVYDELGLTVNDVNYKPEVLSKLNLVL